jgi:hypothetical protein
MAHKKTLFNLLLVVITVIRSLIDFLTIFAAHFPETHTFAQKTNDQHPHRE